MKENVNNPCFAFCFNHGLNYLIPMNITFPDPDNPLKSDKKPFHGFSWKDVSKTIDINEPSSNQYSNLKSFGVLTEPNRLVVIDCDIDKQKFIDNDKTKPNPNYGEQEGFNNLVKYLSDRLNISIDKVLPLLDTFTVITPTEGIHLFYRLTETQTEPIQSNADKITHKVDIRAKGALIMCPCSRVWNPYLKQHKEYKPNRNAFIYDRTSIKNLPDEIYQLLPKVKKDPVIVRNISFDDLSREYSSKADNYLKKVLSGFRNARESNRNNTLSRVSGQAFRLCPHHFDVSFVESLCIKAGENMGLNRREYIPTIASAKQYGLSHPKYLNL